MRPRVLLADDHTLVLEGLRKLLEDQCDLVSTVEDGRALVEAAQRLRPDVILLDISMPLLNGMDAARQLRKVVPDSKLIFLTMHADPTYASEAFRVGASGYLLKRSAASELSQAISGVLKGQYYVTPLITKEVLQPLLGWSPEYPPRFSEGMSRALLKLQRRLDSRLRNHLRRFPEPELRVARSERRHQLRHVLAAFAAAEALGRFQHPGGDPA